MPQFTRQSNRQGTMDSIQSDYAAERRAQDELFDQVENAFLIAGSPVPPPSHSPPFREDSLFREDDHSPQPLFGLHGRLNRHDSRVNGHMSPSPAPRNHSGADYDTSDAEADAGLAAMQAAEEEERKNTEGRRWRDGSVSYAYSQHSHEDSTDQSHDEADPTMDMSFFSGDVDPRMSYGGDRNVLAVTPDANGGASKPPSSNGSFRQHSGRASREYGSISAHPYRPHLPARVDAGGTGGLTEPGAPHSRRGSFDEGDDYKVEEDLQDLFYHPDVSPYRPLPPPPPSSSDTTSIQGSENAMSSAPPYPLDPNTYVQSLTSPGTWVPRSASLIQRTATPPVAHPLRAKTDAEERRKRGSAYDWRASTYLNLDTNPVTSAIGVDLPSLPSKRFNPSKLGNADFRKCEEPWALGSLHRWLRQIIDPEQFTELKESMVKEALVSLFTYKIPTLNIADAEAVSNEVIHEMYETGTLRATEEWVRLCPGSMGGVLFQLTGNGCYSPMLHDSPTSGRCYSHECQRTVKKVSLQKTPSRSGEDWQTFYKIKKEDVEGVDKKEIERQNILHEVVQTEDGYTEQLSVLKTLYRDALASADPPVINPKRLNNFLRDVFGKVDAVRKANEENLLAQLKYRQNEQGPWIKGFSDIFRQWIRKAKVAYIDYAAGFPGASLLMRQEYEANLSFRAFLDRARSNRLSNKLGWDTYLKAPITRLQRYTLLLSTVHKNMKQESEEKANLQVAIEEIKVVTLECDSRVAEMQRKVDLNDLNQKLILRPGMQNEVDLNLNSPGRELIYRGDLQRTGGNRFNWLDCHALLFDHYLVLAKSVTVAHKSTGAKLDKYDVSRLVGHI